ncbi:MAG: FAD-dependent oxidoreductase, partial [Alistipes sp.]|nr:FAD-dependent oxidoreductase [Alistipes sp.]
LFMAGRDISVSHIALGRTRVMRTTAMMGEVVGLAASLCCREGLRPRDIYEKAFDRLQELMKKGAGRTDVPYMQVYTLIDTTAARSEEC